MSFCVFVFLLSVFGTAYAEEKDLSTEEDLSMAFGNENMQSIASGRPLPQNLSPSVTSVITSKEIEEIGARRITDVLEYLPGVHVNYARNGTNTIGFRGISSESNAQVLTLVNGVPMRDFEFGGKPLDWNFPVKNISHIEVIRGPGSMMYGGDASSGVINIVTKTGKELKGGQVGSFIGNENTYEGWGQYGNTSGDYEYAFSAQGGTTSGYKGQVNHDAQSNYDALFGTHASEAPGFTNYGRSDLDLRVDLAYKNKLRFRAGYQEFNNVQTGLGAALALDNTGNSFDHFFNSDLSYDDMIGKDLKNKTTFYFTRMQSGEMENILPPGAFGGALPNGMSGLINGTENTVGVMSQFNYSGFSKHVLTYGVGGYRNWVSQESNLSNYILRPNFVVQTPFTNISSWTNDPFHSNVSRDNLYTLLQDEWNFHPDWYLTTGLRYDYYLNKNAGYSPRVALVWNTTLSLTTKLTYSRAFRPPSYYEQNSPLIAGQTIKPETVDTVEFQIENKWTPNFSTSTNVYWYSYNDLITISQVINGSTVSGSVNNPNISGEGFEAEAKYKFSTSLSGTLNYSHVIVPREPYTGYMPTDMLKGLLNWNINNNWSAGTQIDWIGERAKLSTDPRSPLGGYFVWGLTMTSRIAKPIDIVFRVNNLLNENTKEPTLNSTAMPSDVSIMGRTFLGQIKYSF